MIRHCNGEDPNLKDAVGNIGNCGKTFDDVNHWTTCPHAEFPISDTAAVLIGGEAAADGSREHGLPGWNQSAANGRWYPPTKTLVEASDEARVSAAQRRYNTALHAIQSGIAFLMHRHPKLIDPKHLRVGVDTAKVEQAALVHLLIERGLFTLPEYIEAIADHMETEVRRNEVELEQQYGTGTKVTLG